MENIEIKELKIEDIKDDFLIDFNRYQEVKDYYIKVNENWIIKNNENKFTIAWDEKYKEHKTKNIIKIIMEKGFVIGAYDNKKLIGFACLLNEVFGRKEEYIELKYIYISYGYRNKGIGRKLFLLCVEKAKKIGINKIYIRAGKSLETQNFYLKCGCKDAIEVKEEYKNNEDERQMEYKI
jgi:N-acetylglutamate synthase-like GNAT family acetyltransferase